MASNGLQRIFNKQPCISYSRFLKSPYSIGGLGLVRHLSLASNAVGAENDTFFNGTGSLPPSKHPLSKVRSEMTARQPCVCIDTRNNEQALLLWTTLLDFLPKAYTHALAKKRASDTNIPPGYQLVYFPLQRPLSSLMDDGTDPAHSPGPPYNRRLWAGGFMHFYRPVHFHSESRRCAETIRHLEVKGKEGEEKVFVLLKRAVVEEDPAPLMVEGRTLVFMRDHTGGKDSSSSRFVKPPDLPQYSHTLIPTAGLLFRFSALSYNAHRIHLDKEYCQRVEGHRNLLVHGPLTLILMLEMLAGHIAESMEDIIRIEYKNLAPLYAEEPMTVCGKQRVSGHYDVWIQGRDGGLAVKGSVKTHRR